MPNWVSNTMRVNKQDLFKIVNKKNEVDFNLAFPMPTTLSCESGSMNDLSIYYYLSNKCSICCADVEQMPIAQKLITNSFHSGTTWIAEINKRLIDYLARNPNTDADKLFKDGENLVDNYKTYGATTWYDWCVSNWGCKWNADTCDVVDDPNDKNYELLYFNTPWSPPAGWLAKLAEMKIEFHCEWIEEQGYHGEFISDGSGDLVDNDLPFVEDEYADDDYDDDDEDDDNDS